MVPGGGCALGRAPGFVVFVENPAPSYNEGKDGTSYPDQTMLEIVLERFVPDMRYYGQVTVEADWVELRRRG